MANDNNDFIVDYKYKIINGIITPSDELGMIICNDEDIPINIKDIDDDMLNSLINRYFYDVMFWNRKALIYLINKYNYLPLWINIIEGNILHHAIINKDSQFIINILGKYIKKSPNDNSHININVKNKNGLSPIQMCIIHKIDNNVLNFLLQKGADIDVFYYEQKLKNGFIDIENIYSLLYLAIKYRNIDFSLYLINKDKNINFIDHFTGRNVLYTAIRYNMLSIIQKLIEHHINVKIKDILWITPLMYACLFNNKIIIKMLIPLSNVNAVDINGHDALFYYKSNYNDQELISLLSH